MSSFDSQSSMDSTVQVAQPVITGKGEIDGGSGIRVVQSVDQSRFSLNVLNLSYEPPVDYINEAEKSLRSFFVQNFPNFVSKSLPHFQSERSLNAPLNNVTFRALAGEITALVGGTASERRTLMDLINKTRFTGVFDGEISLTGFEQGSTYQANIASVSRKPIFLEGLSYVEMIRFATSLRNIKASSQVIEGRVDELLRIMNLVHCKNRIIQEEPATRGILGSELRRLSIATEIAALPPLIMIEDPTQKLGAAGAVSIFESLKTLAQAGHAVLVTMEKPESQILADIDQVVVLSQGHTIFAASPRYIEEFFCSQQMGFFLKKGTYIIDFVLDISQGVERPTTQRVADIPAVLQEKFEESQFFHRPRIGSETVSLRALPRGSMWGAMYADLLTDAAKAASLDTFWTRIVRFFAFTWVITTRALLVKVRETEVLKRNFFSSTVVGAIGGYLQYHQGAYGYYTVTILGFPILGTANATGVLFFSTAYSFLSQVLNVHVFCKKVEVFRQEQRAGVCNPFQFAFAALLSDVPFVLLFNLAFSSILYFTSVLNYGGKNFLFYEKVVEMEALVGLATMYLFTIYLKKEYAIRDVFLLCGFLMIMLSGFPFQLTTMRWYMAKLTQINPMRWCFEALMSWKFGSQSSYKDGLTYLAPFGFGTYEPDHVLDTLRNFVLISGFIGFAGLFPWTPYTIKRRAQSPASSRFVSTDSVISVDGFNADMLAPLPSPRASETVRPVIFNRETSISQKSQLSINVSTTGGGEHANHGPTVTFKNLTYRARNRSSPLGVVNILQNASGKFNWGQLSMVLGAHSSGRSSLLHILAGDKGASSEVTGEILFDGAAPQAGIPLWQRCALVEAHDEFHRDLTVKDVITYAMKLRCPNPGALVYLNDNVQNTIGLLHFEQLLNQKTKNLSRGELRRLSIAEEIVAGPTLLLIDEPTTGLPPEDEALLLRTFRELVNQDRTVVASMYQPSARAFNLFDTVLLLSKGHVIYSGPVKDAANYFINSPCGFSMVTYQNPADFLTDISGGYIPSKTGEFVNETALEEMLQLHNMSKGLQISQASAALGDGKEPVAMVMAENPMQVDSSHKEAALAQARTAQASAAAEQDVARDAYKIVVNSFLCSNPLFQFIAYAFAPFFKCSSNDWWVFRHHSYVILERSTMALWNRKKLIVATCLLHFVLGCFFGWILGPTSTVPYNAVGFFAVSTLVLYFCNVQVIRYVFTSHQVFLKEHSRDTYSTFTYWLIASIPFFILRAVNSICFSFVVYEILEFNLGTDQFGYFIGNTLMSVIAASAISEAIIFVNPDIRSGYINIPAVMFLFFIFSGLFVKPASLPNWLGSWAPDFSLIKWTMQGDFINQYEGSPVFPAVGFINSYNTFLTLFDWGGATKQYCTGVLVFYFLGYRTLAFFTASLSAFLQLGGRKFKKSADEGD